VGCGQSSAVTSPVFLYCHLAAIRFDSIRFDCKLGIPLNFMHATVSPVGVLSRGCLSSVQTKLACALSFGNKRQIADSRLELGCDTCFDRRMGTQQMGIQVMKVYCMAIIRAPARPPYGPPFFCNRIHVTIEWRRVTVTSSMRRPPGGAYIFFW
jgi:hypothetical protein